MRFGTFTRPIGLGLLALHLAACVVNPATGRRELVLVSEAQEIAIGRENDQAITAQMGLYPDEELQKYIQQLGDSLAARSERPDLAWTFRVVDDPVVNAFALPGGYIYITRGIMAHMNNEAELASVVGHEIGHVTARHGVSQMTKAQLAQIGLVGGLIFAPEAMQRFGGAFQTFTSLAFLKFGRDDERQADDLGLRYLVRGGYDPRPMAGMFETLERVSAASGGQRVPGWQSTHPMPENRQARIDGQIAAMNQDFSNRPVRQQEYFDRIGDMTFGENPRDGYFEESLFLHPEMQFQIRFPEGWKTINQRAAVLAISPDEDAVVQLTVAEETTARAALEGFLSQEGIDATGPPMGSIHGFPTAGDGFTVATQSGTLRGRIGFVEYGDRVFQLLGYTAQDRWSGYESPIRSSIASFERLTDRRALEIQPRRLKIVRPSRSMDLAELARTYSASIPVETIALINRLDPGARVAAGEPYKIAVGGP